MTMMTHFAITADTQIVASKNQVSCELAGEVAILNLKNSNYYGLDPVGARVWRLIQNRSMIGAVRDVIVAEYDVDVAQADRDVIELISELAAEGLVDIVGSDSDSSQRLS